MLGERYMYISERGLVAELGGDFIGKYRGNGVMPVGESGLSERLIWLELKYLIP